MAMESTLDAVFVRPDVNTEECCVGSKRITVIGKQQGIAFLNGFVQPMAFLKAGSPDDPGSNQARE